MSWKVLILLTTEFLIFGVSNVIFEYRLLYYQNERALYKDASNSIRCCNQPQRNTNCQGACIPNIEIIISTKNGVYYNGTYDRISNQKWLTFRLNPQHGIAHEIAGWNKKFSKITVRLYQWNNRSNILLEHTTARDVEPSSPENGIITHTENIDDKDTSAKLIFSWILYNSMSGIPTCKNTPNGICNSNGYLICNENYYGQNCSKFCKILGHGKCDYKGSVHCKEGFYGINCLKYCENVPHGSCSVAGKLQCRDSYYGPGCSLMCKNGTEKHGIYNNSGLHCNKQYFGLDCSVLCITLNGSKTGCFIEDPNHSVITNQFVTILVTADKTLSRLPQGSRDFFLIRNAKGLNSNNVRNDTKVVYLQKWSDRDALNIVVSFQNKSTRLNIIPDHTIPDEDMSTALPYINVMPSSTLLFKAWIYYTQVGNHTYDTINGKRICDDTYYGQNCSLKCPPSREQLHGRCLSTIGWSCDLGWTGENCYENVNECKNQTLSCKNGDCEDIYGSYYCRCFTGWYGRYCDLNVNECEKTNICKHGNCSDTIGSYTCNCEKGWSGKNCDQAVDVNECNIVKNICGQHGTCKNTNGSFVCSCHQGWNGKYCNADVNNCKMNHCIHGNCVNTNGSYYCSCVNGWMGEYCDHDVDECLNKTLCGNGICYNNNGTYSCSCNKGWKGTDCSMDIDECKNSTFCVNGICSNSQGGFNCTCNSGWRGANCEIDVNECSAIPCINGKCINTNGSFQCAYSSPSVITSGCTKSSVQISVAGAHFPISEISTIIQSSVIEISSSSFTETNRLSELSSSSYTETNRLSEFAYSSYTATSRLSASIAKPNSETYVKFTDSLPLSVSEIITSSLSIDMPSVTSSNLKPSNASTISVKHFEIYNVSLSSDRTSHSINVVTASQTFKPTEPSTEHKLFHSTRTTTPTLPNAHLLPSSVDTIKIPDTTSSKVKLLPMTTPTVLIKVKSGESAFQSWIKENMILVLGIFIGVAVVLVIVVLVLLSRRRKARTKPSVDPNYHDILQDKRRLTLILNSNDELIPMEEAGIPKNNPLYTEQQPNKCHNNLLYGDFVDTDSHAC